MNFLEYLGLESLLGDHDGGGLIGGGIFALGIIGWWILGIIKPGVIDQAAMVFNLIAFVLLLFNTLKKMMKAFKEKKINKIFVILSIVSIVVAFLFGLTLKYHSIIFNYEYNHLCSGIAFTFLPIVIINFLFPFFYQEEEKVLVRMKYSLGSIGGTMITILMCLFIGQVITIPVAFLGKEEIYNHFATYHNITFNEKREEIKDKTVDKFLQDTYYEVKNVFKERCINDHNDNCDSFIKNNYVRWLNEYTNKYGYKIFKSKPINDTEEIIRIVDREYGKIYYNYKINMEDFTLTKISNEEFLEILNS